MHNDHRSTWTERAIADIDRAMQPVTFVEREPALAAGGAGTTLVVALVGCLQAFGVVDVQQASALQALGFALVAAAPLFVGWWTRKRVTPVATLERAGLDVQEVIATADPGSPLMPYNMRSAAPGAPLPPRVH